MSKKLSFIGVGNMATATLMGITSKDENATAWSDIVLFDRQVEKLQGFAALGAQVASSLKEAVELGDYIFLCVKPQNFPEILPEIAQCNGIESKTFITIAAGIPIKTVEDATNQAPVIRVMPNTPMLIGKGVIALCRNQSVTDTDFNFIQGVFESSGKVIIIDESEMNRIICVTGSSPAYVFLLIKAMFDGAVSQGLLDDGNGHGLSSKDLIDSICDTIIGSAELMKRGTKTPEEQISVVASKGGTTEKALQELDHFDFCGAIISAMQKCTDRAEELGKKK